MPASNPYAAGATIYNGGSSTATSGTVDPMGYVERNLRMTAAPSQTRSGLAKAALTRVKRKTVPKKVSKKPSKRQAIINAYKNSPMWDNSRVTSSPTGRGISPGSSNPIIGLPYDLESERITQKQQLDNLLANINAQSAELQQNTYERQRNLDRQYQDRKIADLNASVARGLANSSQYLNQVTKSGSEYKAAKSSVESDRASKSSQLTRNKYGAINAYNAYLAGAYREAANRRAQQSAAGTAGAPLDTGFKAPTPTKAPTPGKMLKLPGQTTKKPAVKKPVVKKPVVKKPAIRKTTFKKTASTW